MAMPNHHRRLNDATNAVGNACCLLEQATYDDKSYTPLLEAARRLHKRMFARWSKNVKRGNKEGWFQK